MYPIYNFCQAQESNRPSVNGDEWLVNGRSFMNRLCLDEYENADTKNQKLFKAHTFREKTFAECVEQFEVAKIFDGMTIYETEQEIEVLYG